MRYAYKELGDQPAGSTAVVRWRGGAANVMLLDPVNFSKYQRCDGRPFFYEAGARYGRPPARLSIPEDGRWYVVVDLGGYAGGAPTVEVFAPAEAQRRRERQRDKVA
jgi:hypothetical protein